MNQESFVKVAKWIFYLSLAIFAIAFFLIVIGNRDQTRRSNGSEALPTTGMMGGDRSFSPRPADRGQVGIGGMTRDEFFDDEDASSGAPTEVFTKQEMAVNSSTPALDRKIVKNGTLSLVVESADWTADRIDGIVTGFGGFTASRSISEGVAYPMRPMMGKSSLETPETRNIRSGTIVVKVPVEKFSEVVAEIKKIARVVTNDSSSAEDVTAAYADLEARLKNKYAEEEAFAKILSTSAQKVSDVLEVTRELSRVRGEIEQLETEKKLMSSQASMAEITIFLSEDARVGSVSGDWRPWQIAKNAMNKLLAHFHGLVEGVIYFFISVLPLFVLYLFGLWLLFLLGRTIYRKMVSQGGQK